MTCCEVSLKGYKHENILVWLNVSLSSKPVLWCDNFGAIYMSNNPVFHAFTRFGWDMMTTVLLVAFTQVFKKFFFLIGGVCIDRRYFVLITAHVLISGLSVERYRFFPCCTSLDTFYEIYL